MNAPAVLPVANFNALNAIPWILVISGWWIVSYQNNVRERRKDIRELIKGISDELDGVLHNWLEYNLVDGSAQSALPLAAKVKTGIGAVRSYLLRISQAGLVFDVDADFIELKKQVTGNQFESKARLASSFDENQHALIWTISALIVRTLEKSYFDSYSDGLRGLIKFESVFSGFIRARDANR